MNDTNINKKQENILTLFLEYPQLSSSEVYKLLVEKTTYTPSLVTVKRELSALTRAQLLTPLKSGRSRTYTISSKGRLFAPIDMEAYCTIEPDNRYGLNKFNFEIINCLTNEILSQDEKKNLDQKTQEYRAKTKRPSPIIEKKELERLVIELSWKSSKIEGNTYTLLDTEKLILENKEATGHDKKEAIMILNHKEAFNFIRENKSEFKTLTQSNLEELHKILVKDLNVNFGLRNKLVGITGSKFLPLDNRYQIHDAIQGLSKTITHIDNPVAKALIALIGISYIQPFEDGNKRTGRLMANALLLAHDYAPLSYRSVNEKEYREAMLVFYELNSLLPIKKIFIEQYIFAITNYTVI